jgi:putative SOS response-associated peptidase YedK
VPLSRTAMRQSATLTLKRRSKVNLKALSCVVVSSKALDLFASPSVEGLNISDSRMGTVPPRYNAAPSQELLVIRQNHTTGERSLDLIKWGLIPHWCTDPSGGRRPINAKAESASQLPTFRDAYALRRCIVPVDGFFEWRAIRGARAKQPYAIAMKDGSPFGLAGLWENWRNPNTGEWERTFAIITVPSNELVAQIHNRMPRNPRTEKLRPLAWA